MKTLLSVIAILLLQLSVAFCQTDQKNPPAPRGPYLGQKPPGMTPEIFAPGIISKEGDQVALLYAPDGSEIIYSEREPASNKMNILSMKNNGGIWSEPAILAFSKNYINNEPALSPDGKKLFFVSNRPIGKNTEASKTPDIWVTEKINGQWAQPKNIGAPINTADIEVQPFYSVDDKLYFGRKSGDIRYIYYSKFINGVFSEPVLFDEKINSGQSSGICISPDNEILIVHSHIEGGFGSWDLYVSFKDGQGNWGELINMGKKINTEEAEGNASFSPDGKYLFFSRKGDIYWVSSKIIDELKPRK
jgi:dipeptidyl aminopeptidase/acylaminoacyl peptidase